jgi:hypothetical protein
MRIRVERMDAARQRDCRGGSPLAPVTCMPAPFRPLAAARAAFFTAVACALPAAPPASGCPLCHTETGFQVRQGIFDGAFAANLAFTVLPFVILAAAVKILPSRIASVVDRTTTGGRT